MSVSGILIHLALGWIVYACEEGGRVVGRKQRRNYQLITVYTSIARKSYICAEIVAEKSCMFISTT